MSDGPFIKQNFPQALLASFSSFGTCQFPTLSFIVDRFLEHVNFENTKFWQIELVLTKDNKETVFTWDRVRFFDKFFAGVLYEEIMSNKPTAKIIKMIRKDGLRYKPYPMTTVDLQNLATKKLNLDSTAVMKAAEKLYLEGYISYPRTETNIYPNTTQFKKIIKNLESNSEFGEYARMLENDGMFSRPRNGKKSDKAHPPIHPIKNYTGKYVQVHHKM